MKTLKRSTRLILSLFFVFTLLLAADDRATASGMTTSPTALPVNGEFVGHIGSLADFGLSTDGQTVIAYLCDGTDVQLSLAEWFKGPVTNNSVDITNAHGFHLIATLTPQAATVTITLTDGSSLTFDAPSVPDPASTVGLYRSEQTINGVLFLGGWINPPMIPTSASMEPHSVLVSDLHFVTCCIPTEHGAIVNEQTGALLLSPPIANFSDQMSLDVPDVGTFTLRLCRQGQC